LSPTTEEVEEKEKNIPNKNNKSIKNSIVLSIFLKLLAIRLLFSLEKLNIFYAFKIYFLLNF